VAFVPSVRLRPDVPGVSVAYTAMHGVGGAVVERAFEAAGFDPRRSWWRQQQEPDGTFPTVSFPNPEEPGAMDLLLAEAQACGAAVALANDPDADRLGVAIPQPDGSWRRLSGDEIGWLFADYILANTSGDDRLVVTTLVSSSLLARMAEAARRAQRGDVHRLQVDRQDRHRAARPAPDARLRAGARLPGGADRPLDKDGITAAVLMAEIAAVAEPTGQTLQDRLDAIADTVRPLRHGRASVKMPPVRGRCVGGVAIEADPGPTVGRAGGDRR
jgi:phosphomannomutase